MGDESSIRKTPEKVRYDYVPLLSFFDTFFSCAGIALGLALIGGGIHSYINKISEWWFPILIGALCARFFVYIFKFTFEKNRPIVIDETGISALAFGRVWKSIAWPDVKTIERIRSVKVEELGNRYGYRLVIVGSENSIIVEDSIRELPELLRTLNMYVQRYQIPLLSFDKGEDTKAKIRATVKDKQERKKLLKKGIQTSISAL